MPSLTLKIDHFSVCALHFICALQVIAQQSKAWEADAESPIAEMTSSWFGRLKRALLGSTKKYDLGRTKTRKGRFSAARKMLKAKRVSKKETTDAVEDAESPESEDGDVIDLDKGDAAEAQVSGEETEADQPADEEEAEDAEAQEGNDYDMQEADGEVEGEQENVDDDDFGTDDLDSVGDDWLDDNDE